MKKYTEKHLLAFIADTDDKAAINEAVRTIRFCISSGKLDRDNEIVEPSAVAAAITDFAKNPVCLACHQHRLSDGRSPVIGSWDTDSFKELKNRCEMDLRFASTTLAEEYWQLYKDKHMRAVSIGFRVLEYKEELRDNRKLWIITKIELYEISCVPVPANREALSKLKDLGVIDADFAADENKTADAVKALDARFDAIEDALDEIKDLLIPAADEDPSMPDADDLNPSAGDDNRAGQTTLQKIYQLLSNMET